MADDWKIVTNNVSRDILYWNELTDTERETLDYVNDDSGIFFRYRGDIYDIGEFMRTDIPGWDGVMGTSYFSGVLIKLTDDNDHVIVAYTYH